MGNQETCRCRKCDFDGWKVNVAFGLALVAVSVAILSMGMLAYQVPAELAGSPQAAVREWARLTLRPFLHSLPWLVYPGLLFPLIAGSVFWTVRVIVRESRASKALHQATVARRAAMEASPQEVS